MALCSQQRALLDPPFAETRRVWVVKSPTFPSYGLGYEKSTLPSRVNDSLARGTPAGKNAMLDFKALLRYFIQFLTARRGIWCIELEASSWSPCGVGRKV